MTNATLRGKPDAGNSHVRFDEGEVAPAKPRRGSLLYKFVSLKLLSVIIGVITMIICGCDKVAEAELPPIGVSFRSGILSDSVMQVHNLSNQRIMITIHAEYPPTGETREMEFSISPNDTAEYGYLEMHWKFAEGGRGYVEVQGHSGRINYELNKNNYRVYSSY